MKLSYKQYSFLYICILCVAVSILSAFCSHIFMIYYITNNTIQSIKNIGRLISDDSLSIYLGRRNIVHLEDALNRLSNHNNLEYAYIIEKDQTIIAASKNLPIDIECCYNWEPKIDKNSFITKGGGALTFKASEDYNDENIHISKKEVFILIRVRIVEHSSLLKIGDLIMVLNKTEIVSKIQLQSFKIGVLIFIILLGLGTIIAYYLSNKLSLPLENICKKIKWLESSLAKIKKTPLDNDGVKKRWAIKIVELDNVDIALNKLWSRFYSLINEEYKLKKELIRLNNLKDDFLAKTTHELKTPLYGIIGISEILVDKPNTDSGIRKDLLSIIYSAQRLSNLVNDLLDATKIKKGTIVLKKISCDLRVAVDATIDMTAALNSTKKLSIENKIPDVLPCVLADEDRLLQILQNLIENAIKYTETGSIQITAKQINSDDIECAVTDTGIGIPESDFEKIFLSFTQGNMNNAGLGLGLSITKNLVELHGGRIAVSSKEGLATTFKFTLPVSSSPDQIKKEGGVHVKKMISQPDPVFLKSEKNTNHNFKIIAVDDDLTNLKILNNTLIASDFQVIAESSGEDIVETIRINQPDLVLLDIMMPNVDGFQVCKNIRKHYSIEKLPILFLTAKNQISDLVHGFKFGGNDYIIKPFAKDELLSRIDMHLKLKTANRRLKELCNFSNSIGDTKTMRDLIIAAGKYLSLDKLVSSVAILYDGNEIFASDYPMNPKTIMHLIKIDGTKEIDIVEYKGSIYLLANLENNYVILCELVKNSAAVYVENILFQIKAIQNNITKLINNKQVLSSVYRISKHLKECNYIKGEGKYTRLYTRNENHFIELQLGQIEIFFYQFLWRVHRSYLVNSKNIHRINKNGRGNYHICFINGESIPVGNKYKNIISQIRAFG